MTDINKLNEFTKEAIVNQLANGQGKVKKSGILGSGRSVVVEVKLQDDKSGEVKTFKLTKNQTLRLLNEYMPPITPTVYVNVNNLKNEIINLSRSKSLKTRVITVVGEQITKLAKNIDSIAELFARELSVHLPNTLKHLSEQTTGEKLRDNVLNPSIHKISNFTKKLSKATEGKQIGVTLKKVGMLATSFFKNIKMKFSSGKIDYSLI